MIRARVLIAAVGIAVALVAGCAAVIDLGDEATLRPTVDASTPVPTPPGRGRWSTAGGDGGAPVGVCLLPDSANASRCAACIQQNCCDISKTMRRRARRAWPGSNA